MTAFSYHQLIPEPDRITVHEYVAEEYALHPTEYAPTDLSKVYEANKADMLRRLRENVTNIDRVKVHLQAGYVSPDSKPFWCQATGFKISKSTIDKLEQLTFNSLRRLFSGTGVMGIAAVVVTEPTDDERASFKPFKNDVDNLVYELYTAPLQYQTFKARIRRLYFQYTRTLPVFTSTSMSDDTGTLEHLYLKLCHKFIEDEINIATFLHFMWTRSQNIYSQQGA